jgi:hypothetical protein
MSRREWVYSEMEKLGSSPEIAMRPVNQRFNGWASPPFPRGVEVEIIIEVADRRDGLGRTEFLTRTIKSELKVGIANLNRSEKALLRAHAGVCWKMP